MRKNKTNWWIMLYLGIMGILIGGIIGVIDMIFGRGLLAITDFRQEHFIWLIPFLAPVGVGIVYCYNHFGETAQKGMGLIFEVGQGKEEVIPKRLIPLIISGTWLTHLFGGSAGREGVAVQIGATVSHSIGRKMRVQLKGNSEIFLVTGMASGFAGLFGTPIAAVFFAMEVLVAGKLSYHALLPALTGAFTASAVAQYLGLEKFTFALSKAIDFDLTTILKVVFLGIIFGLVGSLFAELLKQLKVFFSRILVNPLVRVAVVGIVLSILFWLLYTGRYSGLGTNLITASFQGEKVYIYDWFLKLILTVITLAVGFQGGEVTPLFAIGATLGTSLAVLFGLPFEFVAALGYVSVFGGATNTLLAPMLIGAEVFGFNYLPYFFISCSFAYLFNLNRSIYSLQTVDYPSTKITKLLNK